MALVERFQALLGGGECVWIRNATAEDADRLLKVFRSVAAEGRYILKTPEEADKTLEQEIEFIETHNRDDASLFLIAESGDQLIGAAGLMASPSARHAHTGLLGIFVVREWRGKGIGTLLMERLIDWARRHPVIEKINLEVYDHNTDAIRLYRRLGFLEEGLRIRQARFGPGDYADEVLMSLWVGG